MRILKSAMLALFVLSTSVPAYSQVTNTSPTMVETVGGTMVAKSSVAVCGDRWREHKASKDYVDPGKGERSKAWNEFRKEKCADLKVKR